MGLVDKLTECDEAIWEQYEKVTHHCNKEYGLDKYELARKSIESYLVSGVGISCYNALENVIGSNQAGLTGTAMNLAFTGFAYSILKSRLKLCEKREQDLVQSGRVEAPQFRAWRPVLYAMLPLQMVVGVAAFLGHYHVPEYLPTLSQENYNRLEGLQLIFSNVMLISLMSHFYFADQVPTPPTKKKSVLKTLYEKAKVRLQSGPIPQLEPTKYTSIDQLVA